MKTPEEILDEVALENMMDVTKMVTTKSMVITAMRRYANERVKNLALPHVSGSLLLRSDEICLLEKYSLWLTKNGYMDTDWKDEEPFAIDEFLKSNDR